jgi:spore coat protein CotF
MIIEGLTKSQVAVADKLWSLKSDSEYNAYLATLSDKELQVAMTVSELMILAEIDDVDDSTVAHLMLLSIGVAVNPFE